jgi:hypothetical protein
VEKWYAIVFLALSYLQWRLNHPEEPGRFNTLADVMRAHRHQHARQLLPPKIEQNQARLRGVQTTVQGCP